MMCAVGYLLTQILECIRVPTIGRNTVFLSPLRCQLSRKGIMQQSSFARFMGIENGLHLCLSSIELGKQGLNTCDNALLFSKRRKWNSE